MEMRVCRVCGVEKELSAEYFNKRVQNNKVTFRTECTKCRSAYNLELYHKNSRQKENHRKCSWRHNLKKKYNLTEHEYFALCDSQNYSCAICHTHIDKLRHIQLYVDHSHTTNKVRGLLCGSCNTALGMINDSIPLLKNAIKYLRKYEDNV